MPFPQVVYPDLVVSPNWVEYPIALGDLVLNSVDETGAEWIISSVEGLGGPAPKVQFTDRPRSAGSTSSEAFLSGRTVSITGYLTVEEASQLSYAEDRLISAVRLDQFQLTVSEKGRIRWLLVQRQDDVIIKNLNERQSYFTVQVFAKDPSKYGELITSSTGLPFTRGGLRYPIRYPIHYSGVSDTGDITIINPGNSPSPVWLRIDGPIPVGGFSVNHKESGSVLAFSPSLGLGVGEFLTVDMQTREVLAQGQSPRNGWITSRGWFQLSPGQNTISFSAANYDPGAVLTVTTYPAWS